MIINRWVYRNSLWHIKCSTRIMLRPTAMSAGNNKWSMNIEYGAWWQAESSAICSWNDASETYYMYSST